MAIDPKLKAKLLKDWATGQFSHEELAKKYSVSKATVDRWVHPKKDQKGPAIERVSPKMNRYMEALEEFGVATMNMLRAQAELLSDTTYLVKQETSDIIAHTRAITTGLERFIQLHRPIPAPEEHDALPERSEGEAIVPELVD